ncbi:Tetratricopeptide repeat protein 17, partial [Merops nubicus]
EGHSEGSTEDPEVLTQSSARDPSFLRLENTVSAESNGSEGVEGPEDHQMSEEMLALVDEFENSWPQEGFEGALEVKGRRMDLQGIRVLKKGAQDALTSSCFGDCGDDDEAEWVS